MSQSVKIGLTKNIRQPNKYVKALSGSYKNWVFNEEEALSYKGKWASLFSQQNPLTSFQDFTQEQQSHFNQTHSTENQFLEISGLQTNTKNTNSNQINSNQTGPKTANSKLANTKPVPTKTANLKPATSKPKKLKPTNSNKTNSNQFNSIQKVLTLDLDLEIGPGTGIHFTKLCLQNTNRNFLALEIKYKPLIQTIRRARKHKLENMRGIRYNAKAIGKLFEKEELNNVYLHFPDPWLKKRSQQKHQLIQPDFCKQLYEIQKASAFLDFKTDSLEYFERSIEHFKTAGYQIETINKDLHSNKAPLLDQLSQFELIFVKKQQPIKYALLYKK